MFIPIPPKPEDETPRSEPAPGVDPELERDLAAFVGPNADYYLRVWRAALTGRSKHCGLNRRAFLGGPWLAYRRMYLAAFICGTIFCVSSFVEDLVFLILLGYDDTPLWVDIVSVLLVGGYCVANGNRWYLAYARRALAAVSGPDPEHRLAALKNRSGTDVPGAVVVTLLLVLAIIGLRIVAVMAAALRDENSVRPGSLILTRLPVCTTSTPAPGPPRTLGAYPLEAGPANPPPGPEVASPGPSRVDGRRLLACSRPAGVK
jgi:hypothetical protein